MRVHKSLVLFSFFFLIFFALFVLYWLYRFDLPNISELKDYHPKQINRIFSADNELIGTFGDENRIVVPLEKIPRQTILAFIAAEDRKYFEHPGFDWASIIRCLIKNQMAGKIVCGGSTITQQTVKSLLKNSSKLYGRKVRELLLALQLEQSLTKEEILAIYLNEIFFGNGAYGIEAASLTYFNKHTSELLLHESALLAGIIQNANLHNPISQPERALNRRAYVLNNMFEAQFITKAEYDDALKSPMGLRFGWKNSSSLAFDFVSRVIDILHDNLDADILVQGGLNIHTSLNIQFQKFAIQALIQGLIDISNRQNRPIQPIGRVSQLELAQIITRSLIQNSHDDYFLNLPVHYWKTKNFRNLFFAEKNPVYPIYALVSSVSHNEISVFLGKNKEGRVTIDENSVSLRKLSVGDIVSVLILEENSDFIHIRVLPQIKTQGAFISLDPTTFAINAYLGGMANNRGDFDRAYSAKRQLGSSFKPFVYGAGLESGALTVITPCDDIPVVITDPWTGKRWKPMNYTNTFSGTISVKRALAYSINTCAVKVLEQIGIDKVISFAQRLGISSHIPKNLTAALGTSQISLIEAVNAYSVWANQKGNFEPVSFIKSILSSDHQEVLTIQKTSRQIFSHEVAYIINYLLQSVVESGTAQKALSLNRQSAGKTGTTNNTIDAWYIGYIPQMLAGVWVGNDDNTSLGEGETGGHAALPIWIYYMKKILPYFPAVTFEPPPNIVYSQIRNLSYGHISKGNDLEGIYEPFIAGTEPKNQENENIPPPPLLENGLP